MTPRSPITSDLRAAVESPLRALNCGEYLFYFNFEALETFDGVAGNYFKNLYHNFPQLSLLSILTSVVSGHIGNAAYDILNADTDTFSTTGFSKALNLRGKSWTIRCWVKSDGSIGLGSSFSPVAIDAGPIGIKTQRAGTTNIVYPGNHFYRIGVINQTSGLEVPLNSQAITPSEWTNWHRIIFVYDEPSNTLKTKFNDNAFTTTACPSGFLMHDAAMSLRVNSVSDNFTIDELFVGPGIAWDDADCSYDWDGGTGKTWPDIAGV